MPARSDAAVLSSKGKVRQLLSDDRRFWPFAGIVFGILSVLKGIRVPTRWAATESLVDYSQGLVKRGLFGATLGHWLHLERFANFVVVSYLLLFVLFGVLVLAVVRSNLLHGIGAGEPVAIFAASFAVTYLTHLVGLSDVPLAILTVCLLLVRDTRLRFAIAVPVCVMAVLIHELFLIVFLPVVVLSFVADAVKSRRITARLPLMVFALTAICLGIVLKFALRAPRSVEATDAMRQQLQASADFPLRDDYFLVLHRSTADNMRIMWGLAHNGIYLKDVAISLIIMLPSIGMLVYAIGRTMLQLPAGKRRTLLAAQTVIALLMPFAMNLLGWDVARFSGLACLDCLLVLLVLCPRADEAPVTLPGWYRNAAILVIGLSLLSGEGLQDGAAIRPYPFSPGLRGGVLSLLHHHWDPPEL